MSDNQDILVEKIVDPKDLIITYIHCLEDCNYCKRKKTTWSWLETIAIVKKQNEIPPLIIVRDPESGRFLIFDGNMRARHAIRNNYSLKVMIISGPKSFREYYDHEEKKGNRLWFGITNFLELLEIMRIYAQYPNHISINMPSNMQAIIKRKYWQWQQQQKYKLFGPDDD